MATTRQIIFLVKRNCSKEIKSLFKSTIEDYQINFKQYNTHIKPFELDILDMTN